MPGRGKLRFAWGLDVRLVALVGPNLLGSHRFHRHDCGLVVWWAHRGRYLRLCVVCVFVCLARARIHSDLRLAIVNVSV